MNRNTTTLILIAIASLIAGIGLFQLTGNQNSQPVAIKESELVLAEIPFTDPQGVKRVLGDWQKPVLIVNFWAPWCAPCRREIPALVEIQKEYDQQVQVIGLALDSTENVQAFTDEYAMNYPSFIAGSQIPMYNAAFNNKSGSLPFTAFIDQDRKLRSFHSGEITSQQLHEKINELL